MGRPRGNAQSVKSVLKSVRLTPVEQAILERRFGTCSKALRVLVDAHLYGPPRFRSTNTVPSTESRGHGVPTPPERAS